MWGVLRWRGVGSAKVCGGVGVLRCVVVCGEC